MVICYAMLLQGFCTLVHSLISSTKQLSITLQGKDTTIEEAILASNLALKFLDRQSTDNAYQTFYKHILDSSKDLTDDQLYLYFTFLQNLLFKKNQFMIN